MMDRLRQALEGRAMEGRPALLWLRDDDAVEPTPALDRLFDLPRAGVPLTVAAIPAGTGPALAQAVAFVPGIEVAQHGWSHANHAGTGEKKQELGAHRPTEAVMEEVARGFAHLAALHGPRFVPLMVPPWNRIAPQIASALPGAGFRALSVYGPAKVGPLPQINTQVDLIDWRGSRGGRDAGVLEAEIVAAMAQGPVGILTHHLVHDAAAWGFLDALAEVTVGHPGCRWIPVSALLP
jgi:peptidoglycan/xylan/chitin deacetylase (PgdA/CDA1 family)